MQIPKFHGKTRMTAYELTIIKPFLIHHIAIDVIMEDLDLPVIFRVEYECLVIALWIMPHHFSNYTCQAFATIAHVSRFAANEILGSRGKVNHGYDSLRSSSDTAYRLLLLISILSPSGLCNCSTFTSQVVCFGVSSSKERDMKDCCSTGLLAE